jgi:hypothetical protein
MAIKVITSKFTSKEAKELLEKSQKIIDEKIKGPALKEKKETTPAFFKRDAIDVKKIDAGEGLKPKKIKKAPIVSEDKAEKLLFRKDSKIKPSKLDDFNIAKIETRDDILKFIDEISVQFKSGIDKQKRGKISNEATKEMATLLNLNSEKLGETLLSLKPGQTLNAETILAARELLVASLNKLDDLAVKAKTGGTEDILNFRQHFAVTAELQKIIKGVQTETGRALQQFKIPVRDKRFTAANFDDLNRQQLMAELGGEEQIRNLALGYLKLDTAVARAAVNEKVGLIGNLSKASDALAEVFINAILSNPLTHIRNGAGNWITQGILLQERRAAARLFGGKIDEATGEMGIAEFEGIAKAYGKSMASQEMWGAVGRIFAMDSIGFKGIPKNLPNVKNQFGGSKIEIRPGKFTADNFNLKEGGIATGVDVLGKVLTLNRIPTKLLTVADSYFKNLEYRSEIYAMAYRETVKAVRTGLITKEKAPMMLAEFVVNPSQATTKKAFEKTLASVYQTKMGTRGDVLDYGQYLQRMKSNSGPASVFANYYLPFIQTPANIVGFVLERTPGLNGLILRSYRDDIMGRNGIVAAQEAKTKMALGFMFYSAVAGINIAKPFGMSTTGTSPEIGATFKQKAFGSKSEMEKLLGIQKSTINFPNGFQINTTGFDPIAMAFRQASDFAAIAQLGFQDNDQAADYLRMFTAFILSTGENLASSTFMAGVGKAMNDFQNYEMLGAKKGFERQSKQFASSFVPTIARQTTKLFSDGSQRLAVEWNEYFRKTWNDQGLNKNFDRLGDPIENFGLYSTRKDDPIRQEILNTGVEIMPFKKSKLFDFGSGITANVEYTSDELSFLKERSGAYAKTLLSEAFNSDEYNDPNLDNYQKQFYIKNAFSKADRLAYADLTQNPDEDSFEGSLGAYENSADVRVRFNNVATDLGINQIITKNQGAPLNMTLPTMENINQ